MAYGPAAIFARRDLSMDAARIAGLAIKFECRNSIGRRLVRSPPIDGQGTDHLRSLSVDPGWSYSAEAPLGEDACQSGSVAAVSDFGAYDLCLTLRRPCMWVIPDCSGGLRSLPVIF
jgi:hypothetical protein